MEEKAGKVWLVGAGNGDIGLFTGKGMDVLKRAEVVVYDALVSLELLALLPEDAELINAGKRSNHHLIPQERINEILLEKANEGKRVVRLKGGDPFVFGRGGEELELLAKEKIPFEVVPGITSSIAVPAYNGIPVTHRDFTSSFHVITGHKKKNGTLDINFKALVDLHATLVFLMGVSALETICSRLIEEGMNPDMPAAILEKGTTCRQKRVVATVGTLKEKADRAKIQSPAVIVVGKVCSLEKDFAWFEKKPLFGTQVLVTRPKERISSLAKQMRELGAQVIEMPSIDTVPMSRLEEPGKERLLKALNEVKGRRDKVCIGFTSPQGVRHFFEQMWLFKIDMRALLSNPNLSFAVIGQGTRKALECYGIFPEYMPEEYSARALGALLAQKLEKDTTLYLFRAETGSEDLLEELAGMVEVKDIPTYRTVYKKGGPVVEKIIQAFADHEIDYVTFTSASTVKGFVNSFETVDFTKVHALCIGEQTAKEARAHGMQISVSSEATMDSMISLLLEEKQKKEG